ncbi:hypothetical protein [Methylobacter sp. S3L5C]|uniref:hypothetical protein n=1 Tax=Methylobacter sp. S3L5C TaxID=2839024 RepID=UPI001FAD258E|nr:hypothetical protein [Methylobacter sp. S3L5C]UOA09381.1 hypothetical protein KKZ03_03475 [Methylobacter sp. S3L5C]
MTINSRFFLTFKSLALAVTLATASNIHGAGIEKDDSAKTQNPWAINLSLYSWMPGVSGDFGVGRYGKSIDASFIDIAGKLRNFPMAFNGHLEAHYEKLGVFLDGNYMSMDFKPRFDRISSGLSMEMGIMDYGVMYRVFGPSASERVGNWSNKSNSNLLELYAGGRSIWLGNQLDLIRGISVSGSKSFTAPIIGGKVMVEFSPHWFALVDGNVGGFGADNVSFTGGVLGLVGYRTRFFDLPTSVEAGYKVLQVSVDKRVVAADITLNGPFVGLTGYW